MASISILMSLNKVVEGRIALCARFESLKERSNLFFECNKVSVLRLRLFQSGKEDLLDDIGLYLKTNASVILSVPILSYAEV